MNSTLNGLSGLEYETGRAEERPERYESSQPDDDTSISQPISPPILRRSITFQVKS